VRADARILSDPTMVQLSVSTAGEIGHMVAGVSGQNFTTLTKVSTAFFGNLSSTKPVTTGTGRVDRRLRRTVTMTVKAHT